MEESTILRNQRIYNLAMSGMSATDISKMYGISRQRVYQIIEKFDKHYILSDDSLYVVIMKAGSSLHISSNVINMTFSRLKRYGVTSVQDLIELDVEAYAEKWFVGDIQREILYMAIEMAKMETE